MEVKCVIPCAGYGTRMNMPIDKSKELLPYQGVPLLEHHLELCEIYNLEPHIITRKEKTDLIEFCKRRSVVCQIIDPQGDLCSHTILKSEPYWNENNIMLLPDTIFTPSSILEQIKMGLSLGNNAVLACHKVEDVSKWCNINNYNIIEKSVDTNPGMAWGIVGFKRDYGVELFKAMTLHNTPHRLVNTGFVALSSFKDVTRDTRDLA